MNEQDEANPPQTMDGFESNKHIKHNEGEKNGMFSYIKHWLKFHFFFKNRTIEESVADVINELSTFGNRSIKEEEQKMIKDLLDFYELTVDEIKVPRNEILAVNEKEIVKVFELMREKRTSRIPVFRENLDNIIGFLNVKDLFLHFHEHGNLDDAMSLMQEMAFVPPSMKAFDLLLKMKKSRLHIATIVDEYGGTDGIITINSIISEIVGAIDEDTNDEQLIKVISNGELEVNGRAELDDLKENYGIDLYIDEFDDIETINGLILSLKNEVPEVGTVVDLLKGYKATVKEVSDRMVLKVIISK